MTGPPTLASPQNPGASHSVPEPGGPLELSGPPEPHPARQRLHAVIFGTETPAGRAFDVALIALILVSVLAVSLETVRGMPPATYRLLRTVEWMLTVAFTIEYALRLASVRRPAAYAGSFYGIVDVLAILPTYLSLFVPGMQTLLVVRALRLLRVFRVLKLSRYLREMRTLARALRASARKIAVFLMVVGTLIVVIGSLMYVVEGPENGFTSLPTSMYWTVVTLTTVGYGDIAPRTPLGQGLASVLMILGYGIIAVPTGIVTVELAQTAAAEAREHERAAVPIAASPAACALCGARDHASDAVFCRRCGTQL